MQAENEKLKNQLSKKEKAVNGSTKKIEQLKKIQAEYE